jgi:MFS family permease
MIMLMDRASLGAASPAIRKDLDLDRGAMDLVFGAFNLGYALFQIPGGFLGDRMGPRRALSLIVIWSSVFASATAFAWNGASLAVFRFLFGVGQAGVFPIVTRSLSRWIPPTERGWAQGVIHGGARLAIFIAPQITIWLTVVCGWRAPFFFFHVLALGWAAVWFFWYRDAPAEPSNENEPERDLIRRGLRPALDRTNVVPWGVIFSSRTVWAMSAMYACYGWWFSAWLTWAPTYLREVRGMDLQAAGSYHWHIAAPLVLGNLAGGWLTDRIAQRAGNLKLARRSVAITGFLMAAATIIAITLSADVKASIILICLAVFGLEMTVGASWAVPLDIAPDYAGTVAAVMNMAGNIGGAVGVVSLGYITVRYGWEFPFLLNAILCMIAALLFTQIDASRPLEFSEKFEKLQTIERLFHNALTRPKAERRDFIEVSCEGDPELIREIESLLWHHDQGTTRFEGALRPVASDLLTSARERIDIHEGKVLGAYRIDYKLGEGGMGAVYAATDTRLDRRVAVKVVNWAFTGTLQERAGFLREARSAAALAHANIAVLHDVGETDEMQWIVMEYVAGVALRSKLHAGSLTDSAFLKYSVELSAALEHAHARGIIHRDIKPENTIITVDGNLKVIDFGLAMAIREDPATSGTITNPRTFVGTIAYAAPELLSGGEASSRSDIYSAGVVMYEMACGQHPFADLRGRSLVAAILEGDRPAVKARNPDLAPSVVALIERCLSHEPAARYRDGAELAVALRGIANQLERDRIAEAAL